MLLVTHGWNNDHFGGRQQYSRCLVESLKKNNYQDFKIYNIDPYIKQNFSYKLFSLKVDNFTNTDLSNICEIIKNNNIKLIIVDCSSFGLLCKNIKKISKDIKIIIIHHHIECNFFLQLFYNSKNIKNILIAFKMYINEYLSSKYSDKQIFFTKRDSSYGRFLFNSKNPIVLPVAQPKKNKYHNFEQMKLKKPYILFVGGGKLLPNYKGISWFINKVLPKIKLSLFVVGTGYEKLIKNNIANVKFLGKINDLSDLYLNAEFVIAPIFSGSGMKTKIAESAAYGKTVLGTSEALVGYEKFEGKICIRCNNEIDYINSIKNYKQIISVEEEVLEIFNKNYSIEAMSLNFSRLIKNLL